MNAPSESKLGVQRLRDRLRAATAGTILSAAEEAFAQQGLHAARMEDVAARAGVSVGTLYNYFTDRNALLAALFQSRHETLIAVLDEALATSEGQPFAVQLERFLRSVFEHFDEHRRFFRIVMEGEHAHDAGKSESMRATYLRVEQLVQRGLDGGELNPASGPLYPALLMGLVRGMIMRWLYDNPSAQFAERVPALVEFFLHGAGR